MYRNSERFLTSFNRIEKRLSLLIKSNRNIAFSKMVHMLKHRHAVVGRYSDDLLEFAELRNAIVHNKIDVSYAIAEPHDATVKRIEMIEKELLQPRLVVPKFTKKVYTFQKHEPLNHLLSLIHEKKITKFPVYERNEFKGLISQRAIALWLAGNVHNGKSTSDVTIAEVLEYETKDNYRFISKDTSILEAVEIFKKKIGRGNRLEALLITENGDSSEELIGIITNLDIIGIRHPR